MTDSDLNLALHCVKPYSLVLLSVLSKTGRSDASGFFVINSSQVSLERSNISDIELDESLPRLNQKVQPGTEFQEKHIKSSFWVFLFWQRTKPKEHSPHGEMLCLCIYSSSLLEKKVNDLSL